MEERGPLGAAERVSSRISLHPTSSTSTNREDFLGLITRSMQDLVESIMYLCPHIQTEGRKEVIFLRRIFLHCNLYNFTYFTASVQNLEIDKYQSEVLKGASQSAEAA